MQGKNVKVINVMKRLFQGLLDNESSNVSIPGPLWRECIARIPVLTLLSAQEQALLRNLTARFLHDKTINGAGGLEIDDRIRITIGAQACLLILNLDLE